MLSCRIAVLLRPARVRLAIRPAQSRLLLNDNARGLVCVSRRTYATSSEAGEPSTTVKRAVKRAARTPTKDAAGKKKVAAKAPKAKAKKKAPKKAAPKKKKKITKDVTPEVKAEAKAKKALRLQKTKNTELRKLALRPPKFGAVTAWNVFFVDRAANKLLVGNTSALASLKADWDNMSPADREHYNHLAAEQTATRKADYKRWVESHSPATIREANKARQKLRGKDKRVNQGSYAEIKDERQLKAPPSGYVFFSANRTTSDDFKGIRLADRTKLIGQEWKSLNDSEKKKYNDIAASQRVTYERDFTDLYGFAPGSSKASASPSATASA